MDWLNFDRKNDPLPLPAKLAVTRARVMINLPTKLMLVGGSLISMYLLTISEEWFIILAFTPLVIGFVAAWMWWAFITPKWRNWALSRGAEPNDLQALGMKAGIVWPKGHVFEKTEFKEPDS